MSFLLFCKTDLLMIQHFFLLRSSNFICVMGLDDVGMKSFCLSKTSQQLDEKRWAYTGWNNGQRALALRRVK